MTRLLIAIACGALIGAACKSSKQNKDEPSADTSPATATPARPDDAWRIQVGSDTAAGRALAGLLDVTISDLGDAPVCASYKRSLSSLLISLKHEFKRMRTQRDKGFSQLQVAQLSNWLGSRGRMLDQMTSSMETSELGRVHREFAAALADLSKALNETAQDPRDSDPDLTARATNAVNNLNTSLASLEAACRGADAGP